MKGRCDIENQKGINIYAAVQQDKIKNPKQQKMGSGGSPVGQELGPAGRDTQSGD